MSNLSTFCLDAVRLSLFVLICCLLYTINILELLAFGGSFNSMVDVFFALTPPLSSPLAPDNCR